MNNIYIFSVIIFMSSFCVSSAEDTGFSSALTKGNNSPIISSQGNVSINYNEETTLEKVQRYWEIIKAAKNEKNHVCVDYGQREAVEGLAKLDKLHSADLSGLCLININLSDSNLAHVDFSKASLRNANFTLTNLSFVDFSNAELSNAIFKKAMLIKTNLSEAQLDKADFSDAGIASADMREAFLVYNRESEMVVIEQESIDAICFSENIDVKEIEGTSIFDQEKNKEACFWYEHPVKWDAIEEMEKTTQSSSWRLWRDGVCSFGDEDMDEKCYGEILN